jgi:23S rRNA pseudouridine1911/1915/1917 synthase
VAKERRVWRSEGSAAGRRIDDVLGEWLRTDLALDLSRSAVRRLIVKGDVSVDGIVVRRPAWVLRGHDRVSVATPAAASDHARRASETKRAAGLAPAALLHVDKWLVAIDKPPGLSLHATADPGRPHLVAAVQALLVREGLAIATERLAVHHRLDRDTSGVVVFGRDRGADAALARQFAGREVLKVYHALCSRPSRLPSARWVEDGTIGQAQGARAGHMAVVSNGLPAHTSCVVLRDLVTRALVEARPETGRKHQIRVHLAAAGLPILGDLEYAPAATARAAPRLMLHARSIELRHPATGERLLLESPWPPDFARLATRVPRR